MEKPISIILEEFKQELADCINKFNLPFCLTASILKDLYAEASNLAAQQLVRDRKEYEADLKEGEENK